MKCSEELIPMPYVLSSCYTTIQFICLLAVLAAQILLFESCLAIIYMAMKYTQVRIRSKTCLGDEKQSRRDFEPAPCVSLYFKVPWFLYIFMSSEGRKRVPLVFPLLCAWRASINEARYIEFTTNASLSSHGGFILALVSVMLDLQDGWTPGLRR